MSNENLIVVKADSDVRFDNCVGMVKDGRYAGMKVYNFLGELVICVLGRGLQIENTEELELSPVPPPLSNDGPSAFI